LREQACRARVLPRASHSLRRMYENSRDPWRSAGFRILRARAANSPRSLARVKLALPVLRNSGHAHHWSGQPPFHQTPLHLTLTTSAPALTAPPRRLRSWQRHLLQTLPYQSETQHWPSVASENELNQFTYFDSKKVRVLR